MKTRVSLILLFFTISIKMVNAQAYTYLGEGAGNGTSGSDLTAVGKKAGDISTGGWNAFYGNSSGILNTSGSHNSFFGSSTGIKNSTGWNNVFIGAMTGYNNTTGGSNTFVGSNTGKANITGQRNTFIGYATGKSSGGSGTGSDNTFIGNSAGVNNDASFNTFLGSKAGYYNVGSANLFLGYNAGYNETSSNKLYIENSSATVPLIYGDFAADKVGINSLPNTTHTLTVGGTIHATGIYVNGQSLSDAGFEFWTKSGTNVWNNTGNVGIGTPLTNNPHSYKLAVNGKLGAHEVQIENNSLTWSDFVFNEDYKLLSLEELERYIKLNKHLPEIPTAQEVKENGILLGEMNAKLLQKIEELTLYVIDLQKKIDSLEKIQKAEN